mgnify:CR=1 FL=1
MGGGGVNAIKKNVNQGPPPPTSLKSLTLEGPLERICRVIGTDCPAMGDAVIWRAGYGSNKWQIIWNNSVGLTFDNTRTQAPLTITSAYLSTVMSLSILVMGVSLVSTDMRREYFEL